MQIASLPIFHPVNRCMPKRLSCHAYKDVGLTFGATSEVMTKANEPEAEVVVGIAWYRPKQWQRVRDISTDAGDLEDTYEEWLRLAEQKLAELTATGLRAERVDIDSEQLIYWCNVRGLEINGYARSIYAAEKLRESDNGFK